MNKKSEKKDKETLTEEEELKSMYLRLKEMAARLVEIEQRYPHAQKFRSVMNKAIKELEDASHLIDREIQTVKDLSWAKDLRGKKRKVEEDMDIKKQKNTGERNG